MGLCLANGLAGLHGAWGRTGARLQGQLSATMYKITAEPGYLRAELFERETVEETRAFLDAVVRNNANHRRSRVLILVRASKSIFQVVAHGLMECFQELSATAPGRIALVGDKSERTCPHHHRRDSSVGRAGAGEAVRPTQPTYVRYWSTSHPRALRYKVSRWPTSRPGCPSLNSSHNISVGPLSRAVWLVKA